MRDDPSQPDHDLRGQHTCHQEADSPLLPVAAGTERAAHTRLAAAVVCLHMKVAGSWLAGSRTADNRAADSLVVDSLDLALHSPHSQPLPPSKPRRLVAEYLRLRRTHKPALHIASSSFRQHQLDLDLQDIAVVEKRLVSQDIAVLGCRSPPAEGNLAEPFG